MALFDNLKPTGRTGVFYQEHPTRKHGAMRDRLYVLRYTVGGKRKIEAFGWASAKDGEGGSPYTELTAEQKIQQFKLNHKKGGGPTSLAEESEEAARVAEENRRAEEAQQQAEARAKKTAGDFFKDTYLPKAQVDKKPDTWKSEDKLWRYWISPVIGTLPLADVGIEHLDKIKARMVAGKRDKAQENPRSKQRRKAAPLAPCTINKGLAVVRQMWNLAAECKPPLVSGPWPGASRQFKKPKVNNARCRFLTHEEADQLLAELRRVAEKAVAWPRRKEEKPDYTSHDLALFSLHTGCRFGEIAGLTWDRVNLTKKQARLFDTKNGEQRTVFLTDGVVEMLRRRSLDTKSSRYVFPGSKKSEGTAPGPIPYVPSTIKRAITTLGFNDGVTDPRQRISFHSLRHTFASWLVDQGESIRLVGDLLGHKTLLMTTRYTHISEDAQKAAVAALGKRLSPERGANVVDIQAAREAQADQKQEAGPTAEGQQ